MRLAIADPPYPPHVTERFDRPDGSARVVTRSRARRWYGDGTRSADEIPADFHPDAGDWDDPRRHRALLDQLVETYDGWAIATSPDGLSAYGPLPVGTQLLAWIKPNGVPGGSNIRQTWEPVIVYVPAARRGRNRGQVPSHLCAAPPAARFAGAKPAAWTHWVLSVLGYDPLSDTLDDLFPGSGAVSAAARAYQAPLPEVVPL